MAVTVTRYNQGLKKFANQEVTITGLAVMLLSSGYTFDATHTLIASASGFQVSGNGWDVGGELLAGATVTVVNTNDSKLDGNDIVVTATGGAIGPATQAVLYEVASGDLLLHIDFGESKQADSGTDFKINWHTSGIIVWGD